MIEHLVSILIDTAGQHRLLAYAIVGLMAAAEALPVAGTVLPGTALIVGMGALVPSGALDVRALMGASIAGAVAGDGLSFWLGRRFERDLVAMWPLRRYPALVVRAEELFRRHGGKSVFLARFLPALRAFVPLVAGMAGMRPGRFYAFNIGSALLWAPSHILAGVVLGASLHLVSAIAGRLAIFLVLLALVVWAATWLARRVILGLGPPALAAVQGTLAEWVGAADTWPKRRLRVLVHDWRQRTRALLTGAALFVGSLWLFLGILEDLLTGDPLVRANRAVFQFLQGLRTTWGDHLMVALTEMGDAAVSTSVALAVLGWLLWRRSWRAIGYWLVAVGGAASFTPLIKYLVHWPRPMDLYDGWDAFSFPSGHATINATLYGFLAFLAACELHPRRRPWLVGGASVLIALIAASRLYLGAHWLADVVAGIAFAMAWVALLALGYLRLPPRHLGAGGLLGIGLLAFVLAWGVHMDRRFRDDLLRYAPREEVRQISLADWRSGAYRRLSARRIDLGGETEEPMTLQWAGNPESLRRRLADAGWRTSAPWTLNNAVLWIESGVSVLALPVLPKLHDGRVPVLRLVHVVDGGHPDRARLVLLLWSTNVVAGAGAVQPLWLGSVTEQRFHRPLGLFTVASTLPAANSPRDALADGLPGADVVGRAAESDGTWDGRLLLAREAIP